MNRNTLYLLLGALIVIIICFSVYTYQQETKPSGVELKINENGVSVEQN